jgi:phage terminase small subunit
MKNKGLVVQLKPHQPAINALVPRLCPADLSPEITEEWHRIGTLLCELDRLKPHYVDTVTEYCLAVVRLRTLRAEFKTLDDEFITTSGRYGLRIKPRPELAEISETWRRWKSLARDLGFSPKSDQSLQQTRVPYGCATFTTDDEDESEFA